jgi:ABC-2 type transport system permease protein
MFVVTIPPRFERDLRAGRSRDPAQHRRDRDAAGRHRRGLHQEHHRRSRPDVHVALGRRGSGPSNLVVRKLFNANGVSAWFVSIVGIINQLTLLTSC